MTFTDIAGAWLITQLLSRMFGDKLKPQPQAQPRPTPPIVPITPAKPAPVPLTKPADIPWPAHAGIPGADAIVKPTAPTAAPPKPPPPPPIVDEKQPQMQKGAPAVTAAAQKGIDAMRKQQEERGTGTGTRQYRPKLRGLTKKEVDRAKELLGGWELGKTWRSADDPAIIYKAARHGTKKAIEVWTSNPDHW